MKAVVDEETCIGCGACIDIAPNVYSWTDDEKAKAIDGPIPEGEQDAAKEGAESCPVDAIKIEE